MTRARDIADLVDANGDIVAGALDNVPAADLVNDTTPQLGGALDAQSNNITSVGNLGIGTASASGLLNVHNASGDANMFITTGTTNSSTTILFGDSGSTDRGRVQYDHNNDSMRFNTSGSERMRIDASGRVTTPNQPFFQCEHATNNSMSIAVNSYINHTNRVHNVGNHVNTSGTFTAPVAGVYGLFWKMICAGSVNNIHTSFLFSAGSHGGSNYHYSPASPSNTWQVLQMGGYYYLPSGCTVRVYNHSTPWTGHGGSWSVFSGYLLG